MTSTRIRTPLLIYRWPLRLLIAAALLFPLACEPQADRRCFTYTYQFINADGVTVRTLKTRTYIEPSESGPLTVLLTSQGREPCTETQ